MTPAQHRQAATDLLASTPNGNPDQLLINAERAQVHAVLATKAGTGTNYAAAETLLAKEEAATGYIPSYWLAQALSHAHLAN